MSLIVKALITTTMSFVLIGCGTTQYKSGDYFFPSIFASGSDPHYKKEGTYLNSDFYVVTPKKQQIEMQAGLLVRNERVIQPLTQEDVSRIRAVLAQQANASAELERTKIQKTQKNIKNINNQIQNFRQLASKDPISQALNYSAGFSEEASGYQFFYPADNKQGKCIYGLVTDGSRMPAMVQMMGGYMGIGANSYNAKLEQEMIDLNMGNIKDVNFYQITGTTAGTKYARGTPYLNYQTKVEGLPDYFNCSSQVCSLERLRRAWSLIAKQCPGVKKSF